MNKFLAIVGGCVAAFFEAYWLIILLVGIAILLDFITGMVKAVVVGEGLESAKGAKGFWKKIARLLALAFGIFMDAVVPMVLRVGIGITLPFNSPIGLIVGVYLIIIESISICENLYQCDVGIPNFIVDLLKVSKEKLNKPE